MTDRPSDHLLQDLDTLLATQGQLQFAKDHYDEDQATHFGIALLDFMRVHGMELRRRLAAAPEGAQEPVAFIDPRHLALMRGATGFFSNTLRTPNNPGEGTVPLYTTPPQPQGAQATVPIGYARADELALLRGSPRAHATLFSQRCPANPAINIPVYAGQPPAEPLVLPQPVEAILAGLRAATNTGGAVGGTQEIATMYQNACVRFVQQHGDAMVAILSTWARDRREAERYRWLRESPHGLPISAAAARDPAEFDRAIDAAMGAEGGGNG